MTADHQIRDATVDDVPLILRFIRDLARFENLEHEVVATEAGLRASLFGADPGARVIFAEVEGEALGFALYFFNYSTFLGKKGLYLEDLYVTEAARGRGLGLALFRALARIALDEGCDRLDWWVLDWNAPAIKFYRDLGAEGMEDWTVQRLTGEALARLAAPSA